MDLREMCLSRYALPACFNDCHCHCQGNVQDYESKQTVAMYVSNFLQSHWMSTYYLLKCDKINVLKKKLGVLLYVVNVHPVIKLQIT
jgi:hypothetical protein